MAVMVTMMMMMMMVRSCTFHKDDATHLLLWLLRLGRFGTSCNPMIMGFHNCSSTAINNSFAM